MLSVGQAPCAHPGPGDTQRGLGPRLLAAGLAGREFTSWLGSGEGGQDVRTACGKAGAVPGAGGSLGAALALQASGSASWPSCLEGGPGGRAEAAKARPKPQAWHAHTPTNLPKLAEGHLPCHPPDGHCMREAHSGAAAECNSTGAKQVPVPAVQWPYPWLPPASSGPCGRRGLGSLLSDESGRRRDRPRVCSGARPKGTVLRLAPPGGDGGGTCRGSVGGLLGTRWLQLPHLPRGRPD